MAAKFPSQVPEFIHAVSRLNSWLRSPSSKRNFAPARAIYFLKREAISWADAHLSCLHSTVKVAVECRGCHGTGKYTDSYGHIWPWCKACRSRGRLALTFVQTVIGGGPTWHSPWSGFWIRGRRVHPPYELARWAEGWTVNEPGKNMEPWEVARDLNLVETTFTERPGWKFHDEWGYGNDFHYSLYVGETPKGVCHLCGGTEGPFCAYGKTNLPVSWTAHVCENCTKTQGGTGLIYKRLEMVPLELIQNEHIARFFARRTGEMIASPKPKQEWY
ncbi:MAG TPA: hypothetical protein VND65_18060 [Candidatus Binatia bacterium]|nr:hypothetical protein [Candidatus Binatia bacterium]